MGHCNNKYTELSFPLTALTSVFLAAPFLMSVCNQGNLKQKLEALMLFAASSLIAFSSPCDE